MKNCSEAWEWVLKTSSKHEDLLAISAQIDLHYPRQPRKSQTQPNLETTTLMSIIQEAINDAGPEFRIQHGIEMTHTLRVMEGLFNWVWNTPGSLGARNQGHMLNLLSALLTLGDVHYDVEKGTMPETFPNAEEDSIEYLGNRFRDFFVLGKGSETVTKVTATRSEEQDKTYSLMDIPASGVEKVTLGHTEGPSTANAAEGFAGLGTNTLPETLMSAFLESTRSDVQKALDESTKMNVPHQGSIATSRLSGQMRSLAEGLSRFLQSQRDINDITASGNELKDHDDLYSTD